MDKKKSSKTDRCTCGGVIEHRRVNLCSNCYKEKRKKDYARNEKKRKLDPDYVLRKKEYYKKMYYGRYRDSRLVDKKCDCGKKAIKGSVYSLCRDCSIKHRSEKKLQYQAHRKKNHIPTKIRENIKSRLKKSMGVKSDSIVKYLGCSIDDFKRHLESLFKPGMTWDNYGEKWHIDHIIPLSTDYSDTGLHHYKNTQPLWKEEHFVKTAKENGRKMSKTTKKYT